MTLYYFTLVLHYNGIMDGHSGRRKYIGGTVLVYDNMDIDLFSVQEIENHEPCEVTPSTSETRVERRRTCTKSELSKEPKV